jgi:hypothetical protein
MLKKAVLAGFIVLIFLNLTGVVYGKWKITGNLQIIYKSCECGMADPHVYSCYAPFYITGNKIIGDFEIPEDGKIHLPLVPLVPSDRDPSDFEKQIIMYSYKCPLVDHCPPPDVNGELIVHKISGAVIKNKGKRMLHFVVRLSKPYCTMNVCGHVHDCSMAPWDDEFLAPFQDGYRTKRGENILFHYVVNLQTGHK